MIGPMKQPFPLLTIAGSDSGGAAGLQADLKTWAALGAYGMSALTAVTAQNSARVVAVHYLSPELIAAQIDAVLSDYGAAAIKTGFLGRVEIVEVVAERLAWWRNGAPGRGAQDAGRGGSRTHLDARPIVVVDPVLVNYRGEAMFPPEVADAYRELLFPVADLVTPNAAEAGLLGFAAENGRQPTPDGRKETIVRDAPTGVPRLLVKGAARTTTAIADVYVDGDQRLELAQSRIDTINTHGSGDTLSAAICYFAASGHDWPTAVRRAQRFTHAAIARGAGWRLGEGHGPLGY